MNRTPLPVALVILLISVNPVFSQMAKAPSDLGYSVLDNVQDHAVFVRSEDSWKESPLGKELAKRYGDNEDYKRDVSEAGIVKSLTVLRKVVGTSTTFDSTPENENGPLIRNSLVNEMDRIITEFLLEKGSGALPAKNYFQPVTKLKPPVVSGMIFFEGQDNQVVFRSKNMTTRAADYYASAGQVIEFRTVALLLEDIFSEVKGKPLERVVVKLTDID